MRNKVLTTIVLYTLQCCIANAGELNIGLHLNPAFTVPILEKSSAYDAGISMHTFKIGYNAGLNINYKINNVCLETGLNIVEKSISFRGSFDKLYTSINYFKLNSASTSVEIPFTAAFNIHKHDKNGWVYNFYIVGGAGYEQFKSHSYGYEYGYITYNSSNSFSPYFNEGSFNVNRWINLIAGFKINAVIEHVGLIDYGLTFHLPLQAASSYTLEAVSYDNTTRTEYVSKGVFSPRMAYLDLKLCYYFLNYDSKFKRIRYRTGEYLF